MKLLSMLIVTKWLSSFVLYTLNIDIIRIFFQWLRSPPRVEKSIFSSKISILKFLRSQIALNFHFRMHYDLSVLWGFFRVFRGFTETLNKKNIFENPNYWSYLNFSTSFSEKMITKVKICFAFFSKLFFCVLSVSVSQIFLPF